MQAACRQAEVVGGRKVADWCACRGHAGRPTGWLCRKGQAGWHVGVVAVRKANLLDAGIGCVPNNKDHRICRQHAGRLRWWRAGRLLGVVHAGGMQEGQLDGCAGRGRQGGRLGLRWSGRLTCLYAGIGCVPTTKIAGYAVSMQAAWGCGR